MQQFYFWAFVVVAVLNIPAIWINIRAAYDGHWSWGIGQCLIIVPAMTAVNYLNWIQYK